jgi:hypothetical protein
VSEQDRSGEAAQQQPATDLNWPAATQGDPGVERPPSADAVTRSRAEQVADRFAANHGAPTYPHGGPAAPALPEGGRARLQTPPGQTAGGLPVDQHPDGVFGRSSESLAAVLEPAPPTHAAPPPAASGPRRRTSSGAGLWGLLGGQPRSRSGRPPRPAFDRELYRWAAQVMGMKLREIINVQEHDDGHLITTHDGVTCIVLAGTGQIMLYQMPAGVRWPSRTQRALSVYGIDEADLPDDEVFDDDSPWTLQDLDRLALREEIPQPDLVGYGRREQPSYDRWVGSDPVRARALWLKLARQQQLRPSEAADSDRLCGQLRDLVGASGILSDRDARGL